MKMLFKNHNYWLVYLIPLALLLCYFLCNSISFPLHDFSNNYFPAYIVANSNTPEIILFDIYMYNNFIWDLGYEEVLADFYLNSPFNAVAFYPFMFIQDAYIAKAVFNILSCVLFLIAIYGLFKRYGKKTLWFVIFIPILFYVPIRNHILFGQTYFLIFALVSFSFLWFERHKNSYGAMALVFAVALKVFPIFYGIPLFFKQQWKSLLILVILGFSILGLSIWFTGSFLWETYFFDVLLNAIKNKSTVNFQYNAQSIDVFLKTLFVQDVYYNPTAFFDNERLYVIIKWLLKSIIIGVAVSTSISNKKNLFALLSIWVVTLFLVQSRTATYAQILWIIPAFHMHTSSAGHLKKISFFVILFLMCNIPISKLEYFPVVIKFLRLWLAIGLAILFYSSFIKKLSYKHIGLSFLLLLPLHSELFSKTKSSVSTYVLEHQEYFMIFDFAKTGNTLTYDALGKNGKETIKTNIKIDTFDTFSCNIENNQIILNGKQLTDDTSFKKKPVLVNNCEVYYLTDARSRHGAFTIKKIEVCNP